MKTTLLIFLMASAVLAQAQTGEKRAAPSCGPDRVKFNVKTEKGRPLVGQPDAGRALVYFLEDDSEYRAYPKPTTRLGVDGEWVGATHGNSYFYLSVDPGEHSLCAREQRLVGLGPPLADATADFKAEAGVTYYFKAMLIMKNPTPLTPRYYIMKLEPVDSDEGQILARQYAFSTFQQKK
ncbi:MAG: DUF2846 domain-containing protein [Terriglobia bacterium]